MLKRIKKDKAKTYRVAEPAAEAIVCGACSHVRQPTDTSPDWQCPGCGAAYNKVNRHPEAELFSQQDLRRQNQAYLKKREKAKRGLVRDEAGDTVVATGLGIGSLTFIKGMGKAASACVKVATPANPLLLAVGGLIIAGTLIYAAFKYLL